MSYRESYGIYNKKHRVIYKFCITDIEDLEQVEMIEDIFNKAFDEAEDKIEKELYKKGLMTCNAILYNIDYMRKNGNYLVKAHIEEMDKKYNK